MKKIIFSLFLLAAIQTNAQHFELGAKAGVNISNFTGGDFSTVEKESLIGYHVGGFISFFMGNNVAIQPEVLLSTAGAKIGVGNQTEDYKLTYLNVPVMLKYRFVQGFYLEAGPQIGFKVGDNLPDQTTDDFAKSMDLSIAGGLGYHFKMGLGIGARYTAGISKVGDFDASQGANPDFKNGVIQISLFYTLFNNRKGK